jgi:quinol monooxygenase YgiN
MGKRMVRFTVDLTVNAGKFDKFEAIALAMITATRKEPGALDYDWFLSGDRTRCRIIETYADADAVLAHCTGPVAHELIPKLLESASVSRFEVYGDPGPKAAEILARFEAEIFALWHGLNR